ncbi:hypothetical protein ACVMFA_006155 [Bradyrhizobium liaoningense]
MAVVCRKEWGWIRFCCSVRVALAPSYGGIWVMTV